MAEAIPDYSAEFKELFRDISKNIGAKIA